MSDAELDDRLAFLEKAIDRNATLTRVWHGIWVTGYAVGAVVESTRAVWSDRRAEIAHHTIGATKAAIGVIGRMARPVRAVFGPTPMQLVPENDRAGRGRRLLVAEAMLRLDAHESDRRYNWIGHATNVVLNVAGMLIIGLAYHDWALAAESVGVGIPVGEISIWTQPWQAKRAWKHYQKRYQPSGSTDLSTPTPRVAEHGTAPLAAISF